MFRSTNAVVGARVWLALILGCVALAAQPSQLVIKHLHVQMRFDTSGYAQVQETIDVDFLQSMRGIFRTIPTRSVIDGATVDRIIEDVDCGSDPFTETIDATGILIRIGESDVYLDPGPKTYVIRYRIRNPLNRFEQHQEFYWDLLGTQWKAPIERFSAQLDFPTTVSLDSTDVIGVAGVRSSSDKRGSLHVQPQRIVIDVPELFAPGQGYTLAVRIPLDAIAEMPVPQPSWVVRYHVVLILAVLVVVGGLVVLYRMRNRRLTIATEYFPPAGISPAVAGGFVDHSVDQHDIISLIPHLASQGFLTVEHREDGDLVFHRTSMADDRLQPFERTFFEALFATGDTVELSSLKNHFYVHLQRTRSQVQSWIARQGWYAARRTAAGIVLGISGALAVVGGILAFATDNLEGIALLLAGALQLLFIRFVNTRSADGNLIHQQVEGFRQFVKKAERPVLEKLIAEDPAYYDKTMAYALAFGYLSQWNRRFNGLNIQPPTWYSAPYLYGMHGASAFGSFSDAFSHEVDTIGSVFSSTPGGNGSGGSGFGGISVGGGSGGGGGGGW